MSRVETPESAFSQANSLFVDERYEEALKLYNTAIELEDSSAEYFVKRSACHHKLTNFTDALSDANSALKIAPSNANAYMRKGLACFSLEEYETAKTAFSKGLELESTNASFKTWIRKCEAELQSSGEQTSSASTSTSTSISSASTSPAPTPSPSSVSEASPSSSNSQASSTPSPTAPEKPAPKPAPKYRHDFYQTATHAIVEIMIKNVKKENATIQFSEQELDVNIKLPDDTEFILDIELCDKILPNECQIEFLSTKVSIKMKKKMAVRWATLQNTGAPIAVTKFDDVSQVNKHSYPSSSKQKKDWDKVLHEIPEDKLEGEEGLNKVFKDIYSGGSEEQRRAMLKSFYESGGTVLSTNWDEVGKGKVEGSPPKGMEMHRWDEIYQK